MAKIFTLRKFATAVAAVAVCAVSTASFIGCDSLLGGESSSGSTTYTGSGGSSENDGSTDSSSTANKYCDILNAVLNGSSYNYRNENIDRNHDGTYTSTSQKYQDIPYGFEDADFDAEGIYDDESECVSVPYFIEGDNNNLYLSVRAEHTDDSSQKYYTCYILKYALTDKEYEDLTMVYTDGTLLGPFFIQELSYQKTPTLVNKVKITYSAYNNIVTFVQKDSSLSTDVFGSTNIEVDFIDFTDPSLKSFDDQYLTINVRSTSNAKKVSSKVYYINSGEIRNLKINSTAFYNKVLSDNTEVLLFPENYFFAVNTEEYSNDDNATQITYYHMSATIKSYNVSNYLSSTTK